MALPDFNLRQLLEAGAHFGHRTQRWNPKMGSFIFGVRNDIHIMDLTQTVPLLHQALVAQGWSLPRTDPVVTLDGGAPRDVARMAAALRSEGLTVAVGAPAETAGRAVVGVRVLDAGKVEHEGRALSPAELARALRTGAS